MTEPAAKITREFATFVKDLTFLTEIRNIIDECSLPDMPITWTIDAQKEHMVEEAMSEYTKQKVRQRDIRVNTERVGLYKTQTSAIPTDMNAKMELLKSQERLSHAQTEYDYMTAEDIARITDEYAEYRRSATAFLSTYKYFKTDLHECLTEDIITSPAKYYKYVNDKFTKLHTLAQKIVLKRLDVNNPAYYGNYTAGNLNAYIYARPVFVNIPEMNALIKDFKTTATLLRKLLQVIDMTYPFLNQIMCNHFSAEFKNVLRDKFTQPYKKFAEEWTDIWIKRVHTRTIQTWGAWFSSWIWEPKENVRQYMSYFQETVDHVKLGMNLRAAYADVICPSNVTMQDSLFNYVKYTFNYPADSGNTSADVCAEAHPENYVINPRDIPSEQEIRNEKLGEAIFLNSRVLPNVW